MKFNELNWAVKYSLLHKLEDLAAYCNGLPYHTEKQKAKTARVIELIGDLRFYIAS